MVRIDCPRCERAGRYRLAGPVARFGAEAALPDVLMALAACECRKDFSRPQPGVSWDEAVEGASFCYLSKKPNAEVL